MCRCAGGHVGATHASPLRPTCDLPAFQDAPSHPAHGALPTSNPANSKHHNWLSAATGAFFTATSMIGMIAPAGIIVRNSILLVDFVELGLESDQSPAKAVVVSGLVRARPMILTSPGRGDRRTGHGVRSHLPGIGHRPHQWCHRCHRPDAGCHPSPLLRVEAMKMLLRPTKGLRYQEIRKVEGIGVGPLPIPEFLNSLIPLRPSVPSPILARE